MAMSPEEARRRVLAKSERQAGIPPVPATAPSDLRQFLSSMRENLAVRMGQQGSDLDTAVTFRDLTDQGVLVRASIPTSGGFQASIPPPDLTPPPMPTGVTATGGFGFIMVTWNNPELSYHYRAEVYRNTVDVLDQQGENWRLVGMTNGAPMFVDSLGGDRTTYYYWVRFVRVSSPSQLVNGAFSDSASAQVALEPQYVIDQLQGQLTESELAAELLTPIQAIPGMQFSINEHGFAISTLEQDVDENYAAIQLKAETSVVEGIEGQVDDISAQFTLKLDVKGYVSGVGLMNDGATSEFIVASDAVYFIDPGQSITPFDPDANYSSMDAVRNSQLVFGYAEVEGQKRFVSNVPAYIPEAYITSLMVKDGFFSNLKVAQKAEITNLVTENADIWDLTVGDTIQSGTYQAGVSGWLMQKSGYMELNNLLGRGTLTGSKVIGSQIEGSVIVGTAYTAPTELDNGSNTYLALQRNLPFSYQQDIGRSWHYSPYIDMVSANNSDTSNYYRYRRHSITVEAEARTDLGNSGTYRIQFYKGATLIGDTGYKTSSFENPGVWTGTNGYVSWTHSTSSYGSNLRATLNYPFDGDGQLRVRLLADIPINPDSSWRRYVTVQSTAENDY